MSPHTTLEELYATGQLSLRALRCCQRVQLLTVRDVALYHHNDPRYAMLAGCGKLTRRELNGIIKSAYGRLHMLKADLNEADSPVSSSTSWQARWQVAQAANEPPTVSPDSIAAEWEADGSLTLSDRHYASRCADYAEFIIGSRGIPTSPADIKQHQWYLKQRAAQDTLNAHQKALFMELLTTLHSCFDHKE